MKKFLSSLVLFAFGGIAAVIGVMITFDPHTMHEMSGLALGSDPGLLSETHTGEATELQLPKTEGPYVIMVVGVNGVGKTTTIGKLAHQFKSQGKKVILGAADTWASAPGSP